MKKIGVILFGIIFVGIGIFTIIQGNNLKKRCTATTKGTVVDIEEEYDSGGADETGTYYYYPVVEYKAGGKTVHKKGRVGNGGTSSYDLNQKVDIFYDPKDVETFYIKGEVSGSLFGIVFIVVGVIVAIAGLFVKI